MKYSSKDFAKTTSKLKVQLPKKLVHKKVTKMKSHKNFSKERKHPVHIVNLPSKTISMTIGGLEPAQTTNLHRHTYETIIYVLKGKGETTIEGKKVRWEAGDAIYVPVWAWHCHQNLSKTESAEYIAVESAPLLQNLGVALREES